jgi:heterodisulfide reductase subunit B2
MNLSYYPGCTLKTRARNFEDSAIAAMVALGVNLVELPKWNCCGTVYSLAEDDLIHHVASVRNLIRVREQGDDKVVTLCSFCYNTLKRANQVMQDSPDKRFAINSFMDEEPDYEGQVSVLHLLQFLRDEIGWERIAKQVKKPLKDLKIAPYYGCTLLRPQSAAIDNIERPTILQDLLRSLGCTVADFPMSAECCGSFQVVNNRQFATERAFTILDSAVRQGAEAIAVSCPLCEFNLRQGQTALIVQHTDFSGVPVLFFTQLMALAFGLDPEVCRFDLNSAETRTWLKNRGLISGER